MRVLIDILHPAHVHFFKNYALELQKQGHELRVLSRHKDVAVDLLDSFGIEHETISTQRPGRWQLACELINRTYKTHRVICEFKPDVILGLMGPSIAFAGWMHRSKTIVFYDNETTHHLNQIVSRLADAWVSPRGFKHDYGAKHQRYNGYHELAYLHPNRFTPDADRVRAHGIDPSKPYSILRFVAWESIHDSGEYGFNLDSKRDAVEILSRLGPVYISSESPLPSEFENHRLSMPVEDIHHALAFATVVVGESSTMASEAACLGTHAIFVSKSGRGVNDEQEEQYGLVKNFTGGSESNALAYLTMIANENPVELKSRAEYQRREMLKDVIDVTNFIEHVVDQQFLTKSDQALEAITP